MNLGKRNYYWIIIILLLVLVLIIPIGVNWLMSFKVTNVYGGTSSWVSFFGSYIGSIISGFITFLGVLLTLEFTKAQSKKEKLPKIIYNLEECIDLLTNNISALSDFVRIESPENIIKPLHLRQNIFYVINSKYELDKSLVIDIDNFTINIERQIRQLLINVDSKSYKEFNEFVLSVREEYNNHIQPVKSRLIDFQFTLYENYNDDVIYNTSGHLSNLELKPEHESIFKEIKVDLYKSEKKYLHSLINAYEMFYEKQLFSLKNFTSKLDK